MLPVRCRPLRDVMDVYWLEQTDADVPAGNDWLSAGEAARQDGIRFPKRRADWRLGRWTAKRAIAAYLDLPDSYADLRDIEIRPAHTGAPEAYFGGEPAPVTVSLSHRGGIGMCAATLPGSALGCDLEFVELRSAAFMTDYFTAEERVLIACTPAVDRYRLLALLWSAKESALKALHTGLRLDTRSVIVTVDEPLRFASADSDLWEPLQVRCVQGQTFHGWWHCARNVVRTLVSAPPASLHSLLSRSPREPSHSALPRSA